MAAEEVKPIPEDVYSGLQRLLRYCPNCQGYAQKPPICLPGWEGPDDTCSVCGPLRDWFWENYKVSSDCLT